MAFIDYDPVPRGPRTPAQKALFDAWYARYRQSPEWKEKRRLVLTRDHHTCVHCGGNGWVVHHLNYFHVGEELLEELETVCDCCHKQIHGIDVVIIQTPVDTYVEIQSQFHDPEGCLWFTAFADAMYICDHCGQSIDRGNLAYFGTATLNRVVGRNESTGSLHDQCWEAHWALNQWFDTHAPPHEKEQDTCHAEDPKEARTEMATATATAAVALMSTRRARAKAPR